MDPMTALTFASTATNVLKMFGPGGSSPARLQTIQVEMLRTISKQIGEIHKNINQLLEDLEEVKELLGEIPKRVVEELYRARAHGLMLSFNQEVTGYKLESASSNQYDAEKIYQPRIEAEVLKPLREVRNVLIKASEPFLIPEVAMLLHTDVHAMIACDYPNSTFLAQLKAYEEWLTNLVGDNTRQNGLLTTRILEKKRKQKDLIAKGG